MDNYNISNYIKYLKLNNYSNSTIKSYSTVALSFLRFSKNNITKENFVMFIKKHFERSKPSTIITKFNYLSNFLNFLKIKWFTNNFKKNFILPRINSEPKIILNKKQLDDILNSFNLQKMNQFKKYLWVRILFETGLRASEFQRLKKSHINSNFKINIIGKGYKNRIVFITPSLYEIIQSWPYEYFCVDKKGNKVTTRQLRKTISQIGNKILKINGITPHTLRRSFCTNLIKNGCKLNIVQSLMGHSSISTTSKYIFLNQEEMFEDYKLAISF